MKIVTEVNANQWYGRPKTVARMFDIGISHTNTLITAMRKSPVYKKDILVSPNMVLVKLQAFERFLQERSGKL